MEIVWEYIDNFHFIRPLWLIALLLVVPLLVFVRRYVSTGGAWNKVCDANLLEHLIVQSAGNVSVWIGRALLAAFILAVLALAGPTCKRLEQVSYKGGTNTVFVLDAGLAMAPQDVSPSRLERAKFAIYDILDKAEGDQTALVLFDDEAYTVSPLSEDSEVIRNILPTVNIGVMPGNGADDVGKGIAEAVKLLDDAAMGAGRIIVLTAADEAAAAKGISAAKIAASKGHIVSVVAVGSESGAPAPKETGGFYTDRLGKTVIFKTGNVSLQKTAAAGKGGFLKANNGSTGKLEKVMVSPLEIIAVNARKSVQQADEWSDLGVYLAVLILPFALLAFKKGFIAAFLLIVLAPSLAKAESSWWDNLWLNKSQQAVREIKKQNYDKASELFENNTYKGYASYKAQDYQSAVKLLSKEKDETSFYNLGNALAYSGDINGAIKAYEEAIKINPDNHDAVFNRDYLKNNQQNQNDQNQDKQNNSPNSQDNQSQDDKQNGGQDNQDQNQDKGQGGSSENDEDNKDKDSQEDNSEQDKNQQQNQENSDKDKNADNKQDAGSGGASEENENQEQNENNPQWMNQINEDKSRLLRARLNKMYYIKQQGNQE